MSGINKAIILGNLGKDPEVRTFADGNKVCNFSVATSESWKDKQSGEKKEKVEWHNISIYGPLADIAEKYLKKGSKVYLEGKLQTRKWQDQSGNDRYSTDVVLQGFDAKMEMLDSKPSGGGSSGGGDSWSSSGGGDGGGSSSSADTGTQGAFDSDLDDDVPF